MTKEIDGIDPKSYGTFDKFLDAVSHSKLAKVLFPSVTLGAAIAGCNPPAAEVQEMASEVQISGVVNREVLTALESDPQKKEVAAYVKDDMDSIVADFEGKFIPGTEMLYYFSNGNKMSHWVFGAEELENGQKGIKVLGYCEDKSSESTCQVVDKAFVTKEKDGTKVYGYVDEAGNSHGVIAYVGEDTYAFDFEGNSYTDKKENRQNLLDAIMSIGVTSVQAAVEPTVVPTVEPTAEPTIEPTPKYANWYEAANLEELLTLAPEFDGLTKVVNHDWGTIAWTDKDGKIVKVFDRESKLFLLYSESHGGRFVTTVEENYGMKISVESTKAEDAAYIVNDLCKRSKLDCTDETKFMVEYALSSDFNPDEYSEGTFYKVTVAGGSILGYFVKPDRVGNNWRIKYFWMHVDDWKTYAAQNAQLSSTDLCKMFYYFPLASTLTRNNYNVDVNAVDLVGNMVSRIGCDVTFTK